MSRAILLFLVFALCGRAQDMVTTLEPEVPVSKRVIFLIDTSASMDSDGKIAQAIAAVKDIIRQPIDEMDLAVIAFSDSASRWSGVPEEGVSPGWAKLPSEEAVSAAQSWLDSVSADGGTIFTTPFELAFREPTRDLTIILVSDGRAYIPADIGPLIGSTCLWQEQRVQRGLGKAVVYAIMLDHCQWIHDLVKPTGGGVFQVVKSDGKPN